MKLLKTNPKALMLAVLGLFAQQAMANPVKELFQWIAETLGSGLQVLIIVAFAAGAWYVWECITQIRAMNTNRNNGQPKPTWGDVGKSAIAAIAGIGFGYLLNQAQSATADGSQTIKINTEVDADSFKVK